MSIRQAGILCCLAIPILVYPAEPRQTAGPWELSCIQEELRLACRYWAVETEAPPRPAVSALLVEPRVSLGVQTTTFPRPGERTAILFLVDTSDPRRKPIVAENARQIQGLIAGAPLHRKFGLAAFDKGLKLLAPLSAERTEILAAANRLKAEGKVTELYRSAIEALRQLQEFDAERKALVILSDGLAEDTAYTILDVVNTARSIETVIIGLGYTRTSAQLVALQSLRRLAEDTGGYFVEAGLDFRLPENFMAAPFARLERGGGFTLNLQEAIQAGAAGDTRVRILLEPVNFLVPIRLPLPPPQEPEPAASSVEPVIVVSSPSQPSPRPSAWRLIANWLPAFLVALIMALLLLRYRERTRLLPTSPPRTHSKPLAWLEISAEEEAEGNSEAYPMTGSPWRIGRAPNNNLVLDGDSISRNHAEVLYSGAGHFRIADLGSLNGVFVNKKKIKEASLKSGDRIDIGDYTLYFSLYDPTEGEPQEQTVMAYTQVPEADDGKD